jgi:hypothetical protein
MSRIVHPIEQPGTTWLVALVGFVLSTTLLIGVMAAAARAGL